MTATLSLACPDVSDLVEWWHTHSQHAGVRHFVWQCEQAPDYATLAQSLQPYPDLRDALLPQCWGLLPGWHRIALHNEQRILHVAIGEITNILKACTGQFNRIKIHAPLPEHSLKALAQRAQHGCTLHWPSGQPHQAALRAQGWQADSATHYTYAPHWLPAPPIPSAGTALVLGAGLSGAACAWSLAQRGWQVHVQDTAPHPAAGASGLPVGLIVPHTSADDTLISQITRAGIRCTLQRVRALLTEGQDWGATGVVEHCVEGKSKLPTVWQDLPEAAAWSAPATMQQRIAAMLPESAVALWHPHAAWVKPAVLVRALLQHPNIIFTGAANTSTIHHDGIHWLAPHTPPANLLVVAAGPATTGLLQQLQAAPLQLNPLRGQVAFAQHSAGVTLPTIPVNGKGSVACHIPTPQGPMWITGSTFTRGDTSTAVRPQEFPEIAQKLGILHPPLAQALHNAWQAPSPVQGWAGVRATLPNRMPAVGLWPCPQAPALAVCAGMGARGLSLAMLSGELLANIWHQEPAILPPSHYKLLNKTQ